MQPWPISPLTVGVIFDIVNTALIFYGALAHLRAFSEIIAHRSTK